MAKIKPTDDWMAKATAARDAIERAADDLLVHAEGLAQLAMMARWRTENPAAAETETQGPIKDDDGRSLFVRNPAAEDAFWRTVHAAAMFSGAREAHLQAAIMHIEMLRGLREAVEDVIGPSRSPPPPVVKIAAAMGNRHPGVRPEAVHRQAWLNHLVETTVRFAGKESNRSAA